MVSLGFLVYASKFDVSKREVPDLVWVMSVPACLLLDLTALFLRDVDLLSLLASLGVSLLLGYLLSFIGFYGGADVKALLLIAAAVPSYPSEADHFILRVLPLPVLLIFFCSTLVSILYPLAVLALNLADLLQGRRLLRGFEGVSWPGRLILYASVRRVELERLKGSLKYFPSEKVVVEDGKVERRPLYFVRAEADVDKLVRELEERRELFSDGVLASPTIPMIVFLTVGLLFSSLFVLWALQ